MKQLLGIIITLVIGFCIFCLLTGFGALVAYTLSTFPAWKVTLGSVICAFGYLLYLLTKEKEG